MSFIPKTKTTRSSSRMASVITVAVQGQFTIRLFFLSKLKESYTDRLSKHASHSKMTHITTYIEVMSLRAWSSSSLMALYLSFCA